MNAATRIIPAMVDDERRNERGGEVLSELCGAGRIQRDEIILVSKVGYVQGQNLEIVQEREAAGDPFPDVVKYADGCWHCIHPEFLDDQLGRTLERTQQEYLDLYLLHNPEYFLSDAVNHRTKDLAAVREEYEHRVSLAFEWMERQVKTGRILAHGISSNTFVNPADDPEFTSLERIVSIAERMSPRHHFRAVQFPMNLFETSALTERNQANGTKSLLDVAREKRLSTLVNRPLNASTAAGLVRLAQFRRGDPAVIESDLTLLAHHPGDEGLRIVAARLRFFAHFVRSE